MELATLADGDLTDATWYKLTASSCKCGDCMKPSNSGLNTTPGPGTCRSLKK